MLAISLPELLARSLQMKNGKKSKRRGPGLSSERPNSAANGKIPAISDESTEEAPASYLRALAQHYDK